MAKMDPGRDISITIEPEKMEEGDDDDNAVDDSTPSDVTSTSAGPTDPAIPSTSAGVEAVNFPLQRQEPEMDLSRVRVTYEAHPQYYPCRYRNDPIPQLIQNHGREPHSLSSPCSSRISSSTGDYMETTDTDSREFIKSPDENDGDDEGASSEDNEDEFSDNAYHLDDSRDAFGDDENSDDAEYDTSRSQTTVRYEPYPRGLLHDHSDNTGSGNDGSSEGYENFENDDNIGDNGDIDDEDDGAPANPGSNDNTGTMHQNGNSGSYHDNENGGGDTKDGDGESYYNYDRDHETNQNQEEHESDQNNGNTGIEGNNRTDDRNNIELQIEGIEAEPDLENDDVQAAPEGDIEDYETSEDEDPEEADLDLLTRIQRNFSRSRTICEPAIAQTMTHISSLPLEMIYYILRWVVTEDLDLRSLEMFSMVCKGFYMCSRDSEIWKSACCRVWGTTDLQLTPYRDWRMMYLSRPRLNFNGCYVSRNTYVRHGEDSFRDQYYRPWHMVEYYRYLRFFPEGMVLMQTTTEPNRSMLDLLCNNNAPSPSFFIGYYIVENDHVSVIFCRNDMVSSLRLREILNDIWNGVTCESYRMELQLISVNSNVEGMLMWRTYAIVSGQGNSLMDVNSPKYPPFWFSVYQPPGSLPSARPL